ncbi:MAG: dTDP-4-dehydrorhamnose 3,5-epimerase family protein [Spirochaetota bacterium]|nr:MAG: dTDP-4-dehydrorhamnose 3,5-epimerase family protein [Spirochaetota bacterium]
MGFEDGDIDGVHIQSLIEHADNRGILIQTFRIDSLPEELHPVMSYVSYTEPGVGRGPHEHREQTDIFAFIGPGNFELYIYDNRKESNTYRKKKVLVVGKRNPVLVIIPPGVVHGYKNISSNERGMVINYPNRLYRGWGEKDEVDEIRHEDREDEFYKDFTR